MIQLFQKEYPSNIFGAKVDIAAFYAPVDGIITEFTVWATIVTIDAEFQLYVNGVPVFTAPSLPVITLPSNTVTISGMSVAVTKGQFISLGVTRVRPSGLRRSAFQVSIDDGTPSIPPGGATGEVLTKQSGADYDADWAAGGGGGGTVIYSKLDVDAPYALPSAGDEEFDAGVLNTSTKWTIVPASSAPTFDWTWPKMAGLKNSNPGQCQGYTVPHSGGDAIYRMKFTPSRYNTGNGIGFLIKEAGGNYILTCHYDYSNARLYSFQWIHANFPFTAGSINQTVGSNRFETTPVYLQARYVDSTKRIYWGISWDGLTFDDAVGVYDGTVGGGAMNAIGFYVSNTNDFDRIQWFRKLQGNFTGQEVSIMG